MTTVEPHKLGTLLIQQGALQPEQLSELLAQQADDPQRLGQLALKARWIDEAQLAQALALQYGWDTSDLKGLSPHDLPVEGFPADILAEGQFLPLTSSAQGWTVATADPTRITQLDDLERRLGAPLTVLVAPENRLKALFAKTIGHRQMLQEVSEDLKLQLVRETDEGEELLALDDLGTDSSPVIRLIDSTLLDALNKRASDIHIEATVDSVIIKYRVDGVLFRATDPLDKRYQDQIISRIKVMSELDIAERRIPQDGRFKVRIGQKPIDFRVSIMPSISGEEAVIRILDKQHLADEFKGLNLDSLGIHPREVALLRGAIREPYGMILVTGPTGSGKTTTLYAALSEIDHESEKVITIEDPVEYQVQGVTHVPVNEAKGLSFARGLRSILRHDPDKIMVGEIRDPETAQIAIQSALTGHLVLTTVHANNVFDVLGRFLHMGIEPKNFVSSLNCVAAQRLVRRLCSQCKKPITHSAEELVAAGLNPDNYRNITFFTQVGCDACNGIGFHGRDAIVELLILNDQLRELIAVQAPIGQLKKAALEHNTVFLREAAVAKWVAGDTTLEEINRITFVEQEG